jgi:hypothetical protein
MGGDTAKPAEPTALADRPQRRGRLLLLREQQALVELLERGIGRSAACRKLGFAYRSYLRTFEERPEFELAVRLALAGIDQNVEMALYKSAMEGSVTAQTFWLKGRRPEGWEPDRESQPTKGTRPCTANDFSLQPSLDDELAKLSDRELIERARAEGVDLPPEIASRLERAYRLGRSEALSRSPDH